MPKKPTYKELERRVKDLEKESLEFNKAEQVLKSERDKLKTLLDGLASTNIGVDIVTADYEVLQQNQTLIDRFGDIVGKKCYKEYMSLDEPCSFCPMVKALENNRLERTELRAADGRDYELLAAPLTNPDGTVDKAIEVVQDITERKRTEEALRESEERYRSLFKNNHSVMLLIDSESADIVDANPAAISYYGWSLEELTVKKISDINILTKEQVFQEMEKAKSEQRCHFIFQHRLSNGDIRDVEVYSGPIKLFGQKLLYSIIHDITDRIQAEEELQQSEEKYRTLFDMESDAIALIEVETGNMLEVNKAFYELYGYSKEEILRMKNADFSAEPEETKQATQAQNQYIPIRYHKKKNGTVFPTEIVANNFRYKGRNVHIAAIRDITDRKLNQDALIESKNELENKSNDLEELNAALKVLLDKRREDQEDFQEGILANIKTLIDPYIVKLKKSKLHQSQKTLLNILESNLNEIISPFTKRLSSQYLNLTPKEIKIANLVKHGKTNKEIAEIQGVASRTIAAHRENIRKKLGLTNKKTNLKTFLLTLP